MGNLTTCANPSQVCQRGHIAFSPALPPGLCQALANRIWTHYESGDIQQGEALCHVLLRAVIEKSDVRWSLSAQLLYALFLVAKDHLAEGEQVYSDVYAVASQAKDYYTEEMRGALWGLALCAFDTGNWPRFSKVLRQYELLPQSDCVCYADIQIHLLHALEDIMSNHCAQAMLHFQNIARYRLVSPFYALVAMLGVAETSIRLGDYDTAVSFLDRIDHLVHIGYQGALILWGRRFPNAIRIAKQYRLNWPVEPQPLSYLGNTMQLPRANQAIQIYAFGKGNLQVFHQNLDWTEGGPGNRTLLAFLAMHPDGVSMETIRTHLWAGAPNSDAIHQAFKRLRDWLGRDTEHVKFDQNVYHIQSAVWLDVIEYERLYYQASKLLPKEAFPLYKAAITLYGGPLLNGVKNMWADEERTRLSNMQAWLLWKVAAVYYDDEQHQPALDFLDKALAINPIFDPAIETKMRLLEQMGERSEAVNCFWQYRQRIKTMLNIEPSPRLGQLVRRWESNPELIVTGPFTQDNMLRSARLPVHDYQLPPAYKSGE